MYALLILLIIVVAILCKAYRLYDNVYKYIQRLPGKPWVPIFGNALDFTLDKAHAYTVLWQYWRDLGYNIFRIYICWQPQIILSHPDDVEKILTSNILIDKTDSYRYVHPFLGDGLLTGSGAKWHKHRKIISPAFHFKILSRFLVKMNENANNFVRYLQTNHAEGNDFDIQHLVHLAALDVICETAMGVKVDTLYKSNSDILRNINSLRDIVNIRLFSIWKRFDFLFRFSDDYKIQKKVIDSMHKFTKEVIVHRRSVLKLNNKNNESHDDEFDSGPEIFLDVLLKATVDNRPMTDVEIVDEVTTFLFAGHDTTASAISFSIYMLSHHNELQEQLYREQMDIFSDDRNSDCTFTEINGMKQLELFIMETLRLYPSVPLIGRHVNKGFDLNGRYIPANTEIAIFIQGLGHNPNVHENPEVFDPNRFTNENRLHCNPYDFVPFSAGPRNCVGQKFGMLEIKTVLSKLIRNFHVDRANDKSFSLKLSSVMTLTSDNGILIKLRRRQ